MSKIIKKHNYDFIIIGAGTSGCALAWRLASKLPSAKIALLEEGSSSTLPPAPEHPKNAPWPRVPYTSLYREAAALKGWNFSKRAKLYKSTCDVQAMGHGGILEKTFPILRGCGVGGTEYFQDGQWLRGFVADYKDWNTRGEGWNWDDVVPAFQTLENSKTVLVGGEDNDDRAGTEGPLKVSEAQHYLARMELNQAFVEACRVTGMPLLGPTGTFPTGNTGIAINMFLKNELGMRVFASDLLLPFSQKKSDDYNNNSNLDILTNHKAIKLLDVSPTSTKKKLTKVLLSDGTTLEADKEVIISAGPIESAALLQRSGVGDEVMLFKYGIGKGAVVADLPVGMTLVDRPEVCFAYQSLDGLLETRSISNNNIGYIRDQWNDYKREGSGIFSSTSELTAYIEASFAPPERPAFMAKFYMLALDYRVNRPRWNVDGYSLALTMLHPVSRGQVNGLFSEDAKNGKVDPEIQVNFMHESNDRSALRDGMNWAQHITSPTPAIGVQSHLSIGQNLHANSPFMKFKAVTYNPKYDLQTMGQDMLWAAECGRTTGLHLYGSVPMGTCVDEKLRLKGQGMEGVRVCGSSVIPNSVSGGISTISMMTGVRCADFISEENI